MTDRARPISALFADAPATRETWHASDAAGLLPPWPEASIADRLLAFRLGFRFAVGGVVYERVDDDCGFRGPGGLEDVEVLAEMIAAEALAARTRHVVSFSGGVGSWAAARRVAERHGTANLVLLFCDTIIEDADLYRFLLEAAANVLGMPPPLALMALASALPPSSRPHIEARKAELLAIRAGSDAYFGGRLAWIADGRTPWEVFRAARFLGNSRVDVCSRVLKRELADRWMAASCNPAETIAYVGIDWTEIHRFEGDGTGGGIKGEGIRARKAAKGWRFEAPMCEAPFVDKPDMLAALDREGIARPLMYEEGFAHNNCGGECVKAGQGHYANLLRRRPANYASAEFEESDFSNFIGADVSILVDRRGGTKKPMPLSVFRGRVASDLFDKDEHGGCGCFVDAPEDDEPSGLLQVQEPRGGAVPESVEVRR